MESSLEMNERVDWINNMLAFNGLEERKMDYNDQIGCRRNKSIYLVMEDQTKPKNTYYPMTQLCFLGCWIGFPCLCTPLMVLGLTFWNSTLPCL